MDTNERFDELITGWLEQTAPARLPDRVLEATFARTRGDRQQVGWRAGLGRMHLTRSVAALGGTAAVVTVATALALGSFAIAPGVGGPSPSGEPQSPFTGTWFSTSDPDGGTQTMAVRATQAGGVEIVVTDTIATVCSLTPSTMTGTGNVDQRGRLVIPEPVYACDNGSEPKTTSGPPLHEVLRNLTYVHDAQAGDLTDNFGGVWTREVAAAASSPEPAITSPSPVPGGASSGCVDLSTDGGTYSANAGTISATAMVPAGWHGRSDTFYLLKAPCILGGSLSIEATQLGQVYSDACQWEGTGVEATTPAAVTAALAAQKGHETIGPTDVTIGGHPASRFEFSFPADLDRETCDDGTMWLAPGHPSGRGLSNIDPDTNMVVYVVDVDGAPVVVATRISPIEDGTAANIAELDAIVASLQFGDGVPATAPAIDFPAMTTTFVSPTYGYSFKFHDRGGLAPATELCGTPPTSRSTTGTWTPGSMAWRQACAPTSRGRRRRSRTGSRSMDGLTSTSRPWSLAAAVCLAASRQRSRSMGNRAGSRSATTPRRPSSPAAGSTSSSAPASRAVTGHGSTPGSPRSICGRRRRRDAPHAVAIPCSFSVVLPWGDFGEAIGPLYLDHRQHPGRLRRSRSEHGTIAGHSLARPIGVGFSCSVHRAVGVAVHGRRLPRVVHRSP